MKFLETRLNGLFIIEAEPLKDNRGWFSRIFCKDEFRQIGHTKDVVQVNRSSTKQKGTLRGMHFQYPPKAEIKMIQCISGSVFDVAIDLRRDSTTNLQWHGEVLSSENMRMMYIPEGFAHGFQSLEDNCELLYFHTEFYSPENEGGIRYDDPRIKIKWPLEITEISDRDSNFKLLDVSFMGI